MKRKKMGNKPHALPITHIDLSTSRVLTMYDYVVGDLREVTTDDGSHVHSNQIWSFKIYLLQN